MTKKLIIPALLLILNSCITEKKRAEICASCPVVSVVRDSIYERIKDTTIYITHREVEYRDTIICDENGRANEVKKVVSGGGVKASLSIKNNRIKVKCETDSLYQVIKGLLVEKSTWSKSNQVKVVKVCERQHKTKFDGFTYWYFWITISIAGLIFALKYLKKYLTFNR